MRYHTQWDDFDVDTIGNSPVGWTPRGGGAPGKTLEYGKPAIKRRQLRLTVDALGALRPVTFDAIDGDANRAAFNILTCFNTSANTADGFLVYARGQGLTTVTDGLFLSVNTETGFIQVVKTVSGTSTGLTAFSFAFSASTNYFVRFRSASGFNISATVWAETSPEPAAQISLVDSEVTAAGWVGACAYDDDTIGQSVALNFFAAGTGGDAPLKPRTNAEFRAWLDDPSATRCTLVKMKLIGYNSAAPPYTAVRKVYLSNHGFTSAQQDNPPNTHFENALVGTPNFSREMPSALFGQASSNFGTLRIRNNAEMTAGLGLRDDWLRAHWLRDGFEMLLGDPSWPLHDFRHIVRGRIGKPVQTEPGYIDFAIADLSEMFDTAVVTDRFASGEYVSQYKPLLLGSVANHIELPLVDKANKVYQISRSNTDVTFINGGTVCNNGIPITSSAVYASVNAATDTITTAGPHGFTPGWLIWSSNVTGGLPSGFPSFTATYVIAAGLTDNDFRVSLTPGGTAINLTGPASSGAATFNGQGWRFGVTGDTVTLVDNPGINARLTITGAQNGDANPAGMYDKLLFSEAGFSKNFKDQSSFDTLYAALNAKGEAAGMWMPPGLHTVRDWLTDLQNGTLTWCGSTADGLIQVGRIGLPSGTPVMSFDVSDIAFNSLRLVDRIRAVDFAKAQISWKPAFLTGGPLAVNDAAAFQAKSFLAAYSYGATGIPLDNFPALSDADSTKEIDLLHGYSLGAASLQTDMAQLYKLTLGIFEFDAPLSAYDLDFGSTISLTHPGLGWKLWTTGDPASLDNIAAVDSRLAVVIGVALNNGRVKLKVMRPMPGWYPAAGQI
jgi:hypothetical protein